MDGLERLGEGVGEGEGEGMSGLETLGEGVGEGVRIETGSAGGDLATEVDDIVGLVD